MHKHFCFPTSSFKCLVYRHPFFKHYSKLRVYLFRFDLHGLKENLESAINASTIALYGQLTHGIVWILQIK